MNELMFNGESPIMSGTWYNVINGDSFTVRDSFFQDNQYIVATTDGRMLNYNQLQNYVKSDKPISPISKTIDDIPAEVSSLLENPNHFDILEDDQALINKSFNSTGNPGENNVLDKRINLTPLPQETVSYTKSSNYDIIDRALSKTQLPKIKVNIDWGSKEPQKEIQLLIEVMDISISEIVEWYISKFNMGEVKDNVHTCIEKLLYNKYNTDVDQDSVDKPTKTKTKTQKTLK